MIGGGTEVVVGSVCHRFICPAESGRCPVMDLGQTVDSSERVLLTLRGEKIPILKSVIATTLGGKKVLIESFIDITERKQAEEKLKSREELFKSLIETTGTGYVIIDTDGKVLDANPEYVRLTGYHTPEEIIGRSVVEWTAGYEVEKNAEAVKKCARDGYIRNLEIDYVDLNGKITPVEINATVVETKGTPRILTLCRDITERKQAEEKLKFSNVLLSTEQDVSIDGILVVDEAGKIISFNSRFIEIWGVPQDVIDSRSDERTLQSVIGKLADPEEFLARVNYLYANRDEKSREEIALKDGRVLDRYSAPMSGSDGKYYGRVWNFRDITEQKLMEEVMRESEERYRTLAEASPDQIFIVGRDDTMKYVNPAALKMFRLPYDKVVGTPRKNLFPPDIADTQGTLLKKVFETGEMLKTEEKIQFGSQEFWIDTSSVPLKDKTGNVTAVLGIARDITERKRIEEALRENEIRYRSLFEGAGEGILVADIDTQKFLHANPAMFRMLGYSEEELFTLGVGDIHPKESLDYVLSEFMAQARGEKLMAENIPVLRKDKSIFYADVSSTRILIDEKMCNVGFFSDITERKKAEEVLKRFNEELEKQVKSRTAELNTSLKEKETLLKEIHHRVRNNLQVVSSIISLQAKSVSDPGSLKDIRDIRMRIGTLALVHEIAYLSKTPDSINMRDFLHRCTSKVIDEFKCEPGRINVTITAENVQVALSQAVPCSLIVNELLMNSIRHAFPGNRHGEIKIGFSIAKGNYVLEYSDDGIGFPEGMHPQQAETGGLFLIHGLASQIRGTVESKTRPGTGYTLTFPAEIRERT
jgi:PAS domain S-box-containing protein